MTTTPYSPSKKLCEEFSDYPCFQDVKIYGTADEPLFLGTQLSKLLSITDFNFAIDHELNTDYTSIAMECEGKRYTLMAFTDIGVYNVIFKNPSPMADRFRIFIKRVIEEYRLNPVATGKKLYVYMVEVPDKLKFEIEEYSMDDEPLDSDNRIYTISIHQSMAQPVAERLIPANTPLWDIEARLRYMQLRGLPKHYHCSLEYLLEELDRL